MEDLPRKEWVSVSVLVPRLPVLRDGLPRVDDRVPRFPDIRPEKGPLGYVTTVLNRCWTVCTRRLCKALPRCLRYSRLGMTATGGLRPGFGCLGMPKCLAEDSNANGSW